MSKLVRTGSLWSALVVVGATGACTAPETSPQVVEAVSERTAPETSAEGVPIEESSDPRAVEAAAAEGVTRSIALALSRADLGLRLHDVFRASPHPEGKVHLQTFLHREGVFLAEAIVGPSARAKSALFDALDSLPSMEMYLPVKEHRDSWSGRGDLIVAFQLHEEDTPIGFHPDGSAADLSLDGPPSTPVVSIVPAESFEEDGALLRPPPAPAAGGPGPAATSYTGLWVTNSYLGDVHEPWTKGNPEIEYHLQNASTRVDIRCVEEDYSVEPYRFNQDDENYSNDFLLAQSGEIPQGVPLLVIVWEDDDQRCVIKANKDYAKLTADAVLNAFGAYNSFRKTPVNGSWVLDAIDALTAVISIIHGEDDYVGSVMAEGIGWTEQEVTLSNQQLVPTGAVRLQLKTDVPH